MTIQPRLLKAISKYDSWHEEEVSCTPDCNGIYWLIPLSASLCGS